MHSSTSKTPMRCTANYYKSLHHIWVSHCEMCSGVRLRCRHATTNIASGKYCKYCIRHWDAIYYPALHHSNAYLSYLWCKLSWYRRHAVTKSKYCIQAAFVSNFKIAMQNTTIYCKTFQCTSHWNGVRCRRRHVATNAFKGHLNAVVKEASV